MVLTPEECERFLLLARQAAERAYVPYSNYNIGATVLTQSGKTFTGCNIENSSYSLGLCAERLAIFKAIEAGHRSITALAVSVPHNVGGKGNMPCGACRQVMQEFMNEDAIIIVDNVGEFQLRDLLPHPFLLTARSDKSGAVRK